MGWETDAFVAAEQRRQRLRREAAVRQKAIEWLDVDAHKINQIRACAAASQAAAAKPSPATWRAHVEALARCEPVIEIHWMDETAAHEHSSRIMRTNAKAFHEPRCVFIDAWDCGRRAGHGEGPMSGLEIYVSALHELGHIRVGQHPKLTAERLAWRWAQERAAQWPAEAHAFMKRCLDTYARNAGQQDLIEVRAIEKACSQTAYYRERQRRVMLEIGAH
jgi:hypothetical protein